VNNKRTRDFEYAPAILLPQFGRKSIQWLSFEARSVSRLVRKTRPAIWPHSDTILLTTCPHLSCGFIRRQSTTDWMRTSVHLTRIARGSIASVFLVILSVSGAFSSLPE